MGLEISNLQKTVDNWIKTHGVKYFSPLCNLAVLMEETGELARLFSREFGEQSYKENENKGKEAIAEELSDILFVTVCLANQLDINLTDAFNKKLIIKTERDTERHKKNEKLK